MSEQHSGRAVRALRTALLVTAGACVALGILGASLVLLSGATDPWPGLTLLLTGQVVALVAALVSAVGLRRVLRGDERGAVTARVRSAYGVLASVLAALLIAGVTGWVLVRPDAWLAVVACALLTAQLVAVLRYLRR
ncbi:hypothetical protein GCM10023169_08170 [Georgenia halophila]|uniref:DUF2178 domain-containing protein n=1 Tax=Georgenia halophila TaxID=620889 RepID=A0ABP8KXW7_9MICO